MSLPALAEVIGLPTYWVDSVVPEDAGNGVVRIINCVTRNGVLIPQFETLIHSTRLITAARAVTDYARSVCSGEMMAVGARH
jgi:hypothetical protein